MDPDPMHLCSSSRSIGLPLPTHDRVNLLHPVAWRLMTLTDAAGLGLAERVDIWLAEPSEQGARR